MARTGDKSLRTYGLSALFLVLGIAPGCTRDAGQPEAPPHAERVDAADAHHALPSIDQRATNEAAVGSAVSPAPTPAVLVDAGKEPVLFHVQVAATAEERANGLVGRPTLASDAGLLLVYDEPAIQTLDMQNTMIPTDLLFIGADRRIVGIVENAKPRTRIKRRVAAPSRYVLQIAGGVSARHRFRIGQRVELRSIPGS